VQSFSAGELTVYTNPEEIFGGTSELLALIELIYSAVDDASLWPVILDRVAETIQGRESLLFTSFPDPATANVSCLARMDPVALAPYLEYYASVNVLAERADGMFPDGTARYSHRTIANAEFEKTEFCNDYFEPHNMYYSMGVKIPMGNLAPAYATFMRPKRKGAFEDREGTVLETLMPHLQRALKLHLQFSQLRLNAEGLESGLDAFGHAVFGLNCEGRVVLSNRQAEDIAAGGDGIRLVNGRLIATYPEENDRLQDRILEAVASGSPGGLSSGGFLLLNRRSGQPPLRVTVSPFQSHSLDIYGHLVVLVFVGDPETAPLPRSVILRGLYGLTATEARIADLLASGNEVSEVAVKSNITLETARFHVKRVLTKTGTRRQTELMRLIMSLPGTVEKTKQMLD
jgi:DNA-binding CsgD family transcriptional regulator